MVAVYWVDVVALLSELALTIWLACGPYFAAPTIAIVAIVRLAEPRTDDPQSRWRPLANLTIGLLVLTLANPFLTGMRSDRYPTEVETQYRAIHQAPSGIRCADWAHITVAEWDGDDHVTFRCSYTLLGWPNRRPSVQPIPGPNCWWVPGWMYPTTVCDP